MIRYVGSDLFELFIEGKSFSEVWDKVKYKNSFEWETKDIKNDSYEVRQFEEQIQSTKNTSGTFGSEQRWNEFELDRDQSAKPERRSKKASVKRTENLEAGFGSVFDQLSSYSGDPVPAQQSQKPTRALPQEPAQ